MWAAVRPQIPDMLPGPQAQRPQRPWGEMRAEQPAWGSPVSTPISWCQSRRIYAPLKASCLEVPDCQVTPREGNWGTKNKPSAHTPREAVLQRLWVISDS